MTRTPHAFFLLLALALAATTPSCVHSIFSGTTLASATTPIDVRGLLPAGSVSPGQTICLKVGNNTLPAASALVPFTIVATTRVDSTVRHMGPIGGGTEWLAFSFTPFALPDTAWFGKQAFLFVSNTCAPGPDVRLTETTNRFFTSQDEVECFVERLANGAGFFDRACAAGNPFLVVNKP